MKLKATESKKFFLKLDNGFPRAYKGGEEVELEWITHYEIICELAQNGLAYPCDDTVPAEAKYIAFYFVHTKGATGKVYEAKPGDVITLPRDVANVLMGSAHIRPVDPAAWFPQRLPALADLKGKKSKRMFPSPEPQEKESFTRNWGQKK